MEDLSHVGEREIVSRLISKFDPNGANRIGDDCAILDNGKDYLIWTTDMITRSTHIPEGANPHDVGWYAAAANLSDIAAMGGFPIGMLFALGLPKSTDLEWLCNLTSGMQDCCSEHEVPIIGGDTKQNPELTISGTALGRVSKELILRRNGAKPGDIVGMTGKLGRGVLWDREKSNAALLLRIEPRLKEGQLLGASGAVTSCIDMSDGLSTSLHHLAKASKIGIELELDSLPMMDGITGKDRISALHSGGDFELLFTVNPTKANALRKSWSCTPISFLGQVTDGGNVVLMSEGSRDLLPDLGYEHFRRRNK